MDKTIKTSFDKVKEDFFFLRNELSSIQNHISEDRKAILDLCNVISNFNSKVDQLNQLIFNNQEDQKKHLEEINSFNTSQLTNLSNQITALSLQIADLNDRILEKSSIPTQNPEFPTIPTHIPTHPTHIPTHIMPFSPLKDKIPDISIGNEGVPTNKPTNQQTNQHIEKTPILPPLTPNTTSLSNLSNASNLLDSLDSIKKELRLKFKRITEQEMLVFSTIYQLEEEIGFADYPSVAERLKLTETSIRDYIGKLIKKGIPVDKVKINNKQIQLSISQNLKKIVSLATILQLREI